MRSRDSAIPSGHLGDSRHESGEYTIHVVHGNIFQLVMGDTLPLLLMDVDGVLNPYPACPPGFTEHEFFPEDEEPVRLAAIHGEWLHELSSHFAIVWATGWGGDANRLLCPFFNLDVLPVIAFPPVPFEPSAKVPAINAFVLDRPAAWVDDIVTAEAKLWAENRDHPTLLVEVDPATGLTRAAVDELLGWANNLDLVGSQ